ncbi:MAG: hypothetical protein DWQ37_23650 [Planctomycetota bacterium]|nr:MAG: hypothetical protein DWQ37_23650 [Planctomycetota bacterium]
MSEDPYLTAGDITEYLDTSSDFAFELQCLELLTHWKYECTHGGSYIDPITQKPRQFDIRLHKQCDRRRHIRCAIECKNIKPDRPLVVLCVPRTEGESYHELVRGHDRPFPHRSTDVFTPTWASVIHVQNSPYEVGEPVGKSCALLAKEKNRVTGTDSEVFQKWAQALASLNDLIADATMAGYWNATTVDTLLLPIVVVPNNTLWRADFDDGGGRRGVPTLVKRCSFFVDHTRNADPEMTISHLEFVTTDGLLELMATLTSTTMGNRWIPDSIVAGT